MNFSDRLRLVLGDEPFSRWAERHDFRPSTILEWLNHDRTPRDASMDKLVAATGIAAAWWLGGEGPPPVPAGFVNTAKVSPELVAWPLDNFDRIPFYDVRASAGHGAFVNDQTPTRHYAFDSQWLARHVGVPIHRLALLPVSGTSMEPDLFDGDLVMIDRGDIEVLREGVYVFELDDRLYVKRLSLSGDRLVVASSNGDYPVTELNRLHENQNFKMHGRVLGSPSFKRL